MKYSNILIFAVAGLFLFACKTNRPIVIGSQNNDAKVDLGYRSVDAKNYTGSASSVTFKNEVGSLTEYLNRIPGIYVIGHGQNATVRIRGLANSLVGSNEPLFVIDGTRAGTSLSEVSNMISVSQIDRVTVLKDPSDTSMYGFAGANGVVVIRTKRE